MPTPEGASRADQPLQVMFKIDSAPKQHNTVRHLRQLGRTSQSLHVFNSWQTLPFVTCLAFPGEVYVTQWIFSEKAVGVLVKQSTILEGLIIMRTKSIINNFVGLINYSNNSAAAAAKSLQSCPTLCDPIDGGPPGSPIPGILQARTLEWVAISFSNAWKGKVKVKLLSRVRLFMTPWSAAYQAPLSMGFSRQEHWSGVPLPSPSNNSQCNKFHKSIFEPWKMTFKAGKAVEHITMRITWKRGKIMEKKGIGKIFPSKG